jgi:hypothetical protein
MDSSKEDALASWAKKVACSSPWPMFSNASASASRSCRVNTMQRQGVSGMADDKPGQW